MATKKSKGPANQSAARLRMLPMWRLIDTILGGTETMRAAGTEYLIQHTGEVDSRYDKRLEQSTLWNQLAITLGGWVGKPFKDPMKLDDNVPDEIKNISEDIDRQGTDMNTFAKSWFEVGIKKAFCHVLIEQPTILHREDGGALSKSDEAEQNLRPYWSLIEPDEIIAARAAIIDGRERYTHVRIHERTLEADPEDQFSEIWKEQIRVYDRTDSGVTVSLWHRVANKDENTSDGWKMEEEPIDLGIDEIPMVTFYADRQGFLLGRSPLQDLAEMNKKHWNSQSDQDNILTIARFPILAASGVSNMSGGDALDSDPQSGNDFNGTKGAVIGPFNVLVSEEIGSKFYYVEHKGTSIAAGQLSLDKLEAKMSAYGSEYLKKAPDRQTASARSLDSQESLSPLQAYTLRFVDAMQSALTLTAKWMNLNTGVETSPGGTVTVITDFGEDTADAVDVTALGTARQNRDISGTQYRKEMKRRGILADDFDEAENKKELDKEALDLDQVLPPKSNTDLDPQNEKKEPDEDNKTE